jgi:hypothetical protein
VVFPENMGPIANSKYPGIWIGLDWIGLDWIGLDLGGSKMGPTFYLSIFNLIVCHRTSYNG